MDLHRFLFVLSVNCHDFLVEIWEMAKHTIFSVRIHGNFQSIDIKRERRGESRHLRPKRIKQSEKRPLVLVAFPTV